MDNQLGFIHPETLRKRKTRENETPDQREKRRARDQENKRRKLAEETTEQRMAKLSKERERMRKKRARSVLGNIDGNTNHQDENQGLEQRLSESDQCNTILN